MELFKLLGTIAIDNKNANKALHETSGIGQQAESKMGKAFSSIGSGAVKVGKAIATGMAVGAGACATLATAAIKSYADYEQLVGGVETLFGTRGAKSVEEYAQMVGKSVDSVKDEFGMLQQAQSDVMNNASQAYKTAGLSVNEYMESVNGIAAALNQSAESQVESAALANQAVIDMSDNAAKMGTSMESIQNAYAGFAKQNYTMLDNLKLGYGGTKEEMQRLLEDAEKISGIKYDISSFADVTQAIHVMQEEMGIAGTTAAEASGTIQGSLGMLKSSWSNLLTGLVDPTQNVSTLIQNLFDSLTTFAGNLIEPITNVLSGISTAVQQLVPMLAAAIPGMISQVMPGVIQGAKSILQGVVQVLPSVLEAVMSALPDLYNGIAEVFGTIVEALPEFLTTLATGLTTLIPQIIQAFTDMVVTLASNLTTIIQPLIAALPDLITAIITAISEALPQIITALVEAAIALLPVLIEGLVQIITALAEALPEISNALIEVMPELISRLVTAIMENLPVLIAGLAEVVAAVVPALIEIIINNWQAIFAAIGGVISGQKDAFAGFFADIWEGIKGVFASVGEWFSNLWASLGNVPGLSSLKTAVETAWNAIKTCISTVMGVVVNVITTIWANIKNVVSTVVNAISNVISSVWNAIKTVISSVMGVIKSVISGDWEGVKANISNVVNAIKNVISTVWNSIKTVISTVLNAIKTVVSTVWNGIKTTVSTVLNTIKTVVTSVWNGIKSAISTAMSAIKTTISNIWNAIKSTVSSVLNGIKTTAISAWNDIKSKISSAVSSIKSTVKSGFDNVKSTIVNILKSIPSQVANVGMDIVRGIGNGITNGVGWIKGVITSFVGDVKGFIKNLFGIASPSKWMRDNVGREIARGVAVGIETNTSAAVTAMAELGKETKEQAKKNLADEKDQNLKMNAEIVKVAKQKLDTYKQTNELTAEAEAAFWDEIRKEITEGTAERLKADEYYFKARNSIDQETLTAAKDRLDEYKTYNSMTLAEEMGFWAEIREQFEIGSDARLEADKSYLAAKKSINEKIVDAEEKLQADLEAIDKKIADRQKELLGEFNLFEVFTKGDVQPVSQSEMFDAMNSQIEVLELWESEMSMLESRIGGTALFEEIKDMGLEGLSQVQEINKMTDFNLNSYLELYNKRAEIAGKMAEDELAEESIRSTAEAYQAFADTCSEVGIEVAGNTSAMCDQISYVFAVMETDVEGAADIIGKELKSIADAVVETINGINNAFGSEIISAPNFSVAGEELGEGYASTRQSSLLETIKNIPGSSTPYKTLKDSVKWHADSMDNASILRSPTIFGYDAKSGKYLGGGEAGNEVVAGEQTLMNMIQNAVAQQNSSVNAWLQKMYQLISEYFPQMLDAFEAPIDFNPNSMASALAVPMNRELGRISSRKDRGR